MSKNEIDSTINIIFGYWYSKYYLPTIFHVLIILSVFILIPIRKIKAEYSNYNKLLIFCFVGFMIYLLIFFKQFRNHDYYFLHNYSSIIYSYYFINIKNHKSVCESNIFLTSIIISLGIISIAGSDYTSLNYIQKI